MLGPNIIIHNHGYGCSEGLRGKYLNFGDTGDFFIEIEEIVEFLDVSDRKTIDKVVQVVCVPLFHACQFLTSKPLYSGICSQESYTSLCSHQGMVYGDTSWTMSSKQLGFIRTMDSPCSSSMRERSRESKIFLHWSLIEFVLVNAYSLEVRLTPTLITETDLMDVIRAINAQEIVKVHEFTAVLDDREFPATAGFFLEINGDATSTVTIILWTYSTHMV